MIEVDIEQKWREDGTLWNASVSFKFLFSDMDFMLTGKLDDQLNKMLFLV